MSYCTSWWHSFDRSAYGIIESSDFIMETVFPSHHQSIQSHACSTQQEQFDQWLDYKSCWQISSCTCWYFYISTTTRLWSNAFRTWGDFSFFCCSSVGEFSRYTISVDVKFRLKHTLRAPLLILIAVCSQSGQNAILKWHPWPLQTNTLDTRSAFASPCRACISNMYCFG